MEKGFNVDTIKLRAVDLSTIQFLSIFGVLLYRRTKLQRVLALCEFH